MYRRRFGVVLALVLLATPALGIGPGLDHGGCPEASSVMVIGKVPVLVPLSFVDLADWLRAATTNAVLILIE